jgi:hypothetical protein
MDLYEQIGHLLTSLKRQLGTIDDPLAPIKPAVVSQIRAAEEKTMQLLTLQRQLSFFL